MLKLLNSNRQLIKQWQVDNNPRSIEFTTHSTELISHVEDTKSITIFYGFLDQECNQNSPAQFISGILSRQGVTGLNDCYGSFIVIHYNKNEHKYTIANDALGDFAVHYMTANQTLSISDLPQALINHDNTINHQRVLHYFALSKPQNNGSFFKNIKQLNPGHCLIVTPNDQNVNRYYFPKQTINPKIKCTKIISEQFKSIMQTAITFQSQGQKNVGIMMSGGMDSTFVAANCKKADKQVKAFSYVFPNMPSANESIWLDTMRKQGYDMHTFAGESHWPLKSPWYVSLNSPINNPYRHLKSVIYQQAQNQQLKILLSGTFADHLYIGYIYWLVDQVKNKPFTAVKSIYKTLIKHGLMTGLRQISPAKFSSKIKYSAKWLSKSAANELSDITKKYSKFSHPHPQQYDLVYGISTAQSNWLDNEHAFKHNIFVRHPFRDRRVVEFLMDFPAWVLGNIDNRKQFVRNAAQDILPKSIINRTQITTLEPLFLKGILEKEFDKVQQILSDSSCQWQNFINKKTVNDIIDNPSHKHKDSHLVILWQCLNYEMWRHSIANVSP